MTEITAKNITSQRTGLAAGELVYECDDGTTKTEITVRVEAKSIPGAVVWVPHCAYCDADGDHNLGIAPHEVTFVLGESDADPVAVFETQMAEQARRAHRAKRQMDGLTALKLPETPMPVVTREVFVKSDVLDAGAGNDVLRA